MKRQYYLYIILAALTFMTSSCKKEQDTVTLGAVINKHAYDGKVYIDDHTPCWHNGDQVFINNDTYSIIASTGSSAQITDVATSSTYRAVFPASIVNADDISSSSSVSVTLPATQTYELVGSNQLVDVPMGAYITSGSTLQFYNLCSIVRITVSNSLNQELPLRCIVLKAETAMLSGAGTATVSGELSNCITMSSTASHSVSLAFTADCPATVAARGTSTFDIVVPAFITDDVTIAMYTSDGWYYETEKDDVALENNTITTVTLNVTNLTETPHAELVDGPTFSSAIPGSARAVVFEYNSSVSSGTLLSTANSTVPIYGNLDGTVWRVSTSTIEMNANPNCSTMFSTYFNYYGGFDQRLGTIDFGSGFNTSNVTDMSRMFSCCFRLTNIDISNFNTSSVTDMSGMFSDCSSLTSLDLSNFNTSNVTNMRSMFCACEGLTSLDVSSFNTSNVTDMSNMFDFCKVLTSLDLSNFNTSNVTNMGNMFWWCRTLTSLDLSNFNTSNVTNMGAMFGGCSSLTSLDVSNFNTSNVTNMSGMFSGCSSLTSLDVSNFNTSNVTNMSGMFSGCSSLTSLDVSNFNTSNVTNMSGMFSGCSSLTSLDVSNFNTSNVTNMSGMFSGCSSLTSLDVSNFNTSNVTDMSYIFCDCSSLTSLDVSNFNTSNVTDMSYMLGDCSSLTSLDLSSFYTTSVNNMQAMFRYCRNLTSLNLAHFDMSHLTSHNYYDVNPTQTLSGKYDMCSELSIIPGHCTITCPLAVQTELEGGTDLPTSGVTFTWQRPSSK